MGQGYGGLVDPRRRRTQYGGGGNDPFGGGGNDPYGGPEALGPLPMSGNLGFRALPGPSAGRIDPNMRDPNYQPPPMPNVFDPYEDKPYGRGSQGPQEVAPTNDMLNIYRGLPGFNPLEMNKGQVPSRFRIASGVGQSATGFGRLQSLSDATMRYRGMGPFRPGSHGGGQGFGEGYPGDALKRLLEARLGGGGF